MDLITLKAAVAAAKKATAEAIVNKADLVGGKVPASQLPSYVDDVIDGYYYDGVFYEDSGHTVEITPEQGKIYVDITTEDGLSYRWIDGRYVPIGGRGIENHDELGNRSLEDQHPINAITGLRDELDKIKPSIEKLNQYLYRVTYVELPEEEPTDINLGGCSSYVQDGKLFRNLDLGYSEDASIIVECPDFTGTTIGSVSDINALPYKVVDGVNKHGIKVATHILFNDWSWDGGGDIPLYRLPYIALTTMESIDDISDLPLDNLCKIESLGDYIAQYIITDGETTYVIMPSTSDNTYVAVDATENPKLTNFRWVADEEVVRTDLQNRPTGVERWNAMPCELSELKFTAAYESAGRLSEFIGINDTTKDSTDEELMAIYELAAEEYQRRTRDGETWQTMHSVVYGNSMEHLFIQEDWNKDYMAVSGVTDAEKATWNAKQDPIEDLEEEYPTFFEFTDTVMKKPDSTNNNIVLFDENGDIKDSEKKLEEYIEYADDLAMKHLMDDVPEDANVIESLRVSTTIPEAADSEGFKGQVAFDSDYMYICIADNAWKKIALQTI